MSDEKKIIDELEQEMHDIAIYNVRLAYPVTILEHSEDGYSRYVESYLEPSEDEYSQYVKSYKLMPDALYEKMRKEKGLNHIDCQIEAKKHQREVIRNNISKIWGDYE